MVVCDKEYQKYLEELHNSVNVAFALAAEARKKNLDPTDEVEIKIAKDVASRVEALVGPKGIAKIIRELEQSQLSREKIAFKVVEKIINREIVDGNLEFLIEQAVRTAVGILTEGMLVAPTEGISKLKIKTNADGTNYISIYFTGPIRSAGGTVAALSVVLADYARRLVNLSNYRPTESEIERYVEEVNIYEARVSHLQYKPSDDDVRWIVKNCPVCIDGEPTEDIEVSIYRDLPRVETNRIRGGVPLVICEGIAQKAAKVYKICKSFNIDWNWLEKLIKLKSSTEKIEIKPDYSFLEGVVAGRPILSYPSLPGGFRLRYGRGRANGLMAKSIHPATMVLLDNFLAVGTHIKIERPGKGAVLTVCDNLEGPIVLLKDGSTIQIKTKEEAEKVKDKVEKILFLGDILVTYGDFLKSNHPLVPSAWCEEWWEEECRSKGINPVSFNSVKEAFEFAKAYDIPLHPAYTLFWHDLTNEEFLSLFKFLLKAKKTENSIILPLSEEKKILEKLGVEHYLSNEKIFVPLKFAEILFFSFGGDENGIDSKKFDETFREDLTPLELVNKLSNVKIKAKAPTYVGARMGRPEKARERKMSGDVNVLFPTGSQNRSLMKIFRNIYGKGSSKFITAELCAYFCPNCETQTLYSKCEKCGTKAVRKNFCSICGKLTLQEEHCGKKTQPFIQKQVNLYELIENLRKKFGYLVEDIKGVKALSSPARVPERLEKGFLRAKHKIFVFRDGTCRFDTTDVPLTHFKPKEFGMSLETLYKLGYKYDYLGKPLENAEQIVALKPQDIILSEEGGEYFLRVAKFVDDLLVNFYGLEPFYNAQKKEDLISQLFIGLSPHTSSGVLVRLIGFTKAKVTYGHPYFHAAKRRNADGDEDSLILLLDAFLNFSKEFLSDVRGGTMDAPITLSLVIDPKEVDDEVHSMEVVDRFPLEFYYATERFASPSDVNIKTVKDILGKEEQFKSLGLTLDSSSLEDANLETSYVKFNTIAEKINAQFKLYKKLRAIDIKESAERLILSHFIPDIYGNLRSFSRQNIRCTNCNEVYRRIPLTGRCIKCNGNLVLTINKGGIEKYLDISIKLAEEYSLPEYLKQRLILIKKEIKEIFEDEKVKQYSLEDFM